LTGRITLTYDKPAIAAAKGVCQVKDLDLLILLAEGVKQAAEDDDRDMAHDLFDKIIDVVARMQANESLPPT
jgi:hypothetical protein